MKLSIFEDRLTIKCLSCHRNFSAAWHGTDNKKNFDDCIL